MKKITNYQLNSLKEDLAKKVSKEVVEKLHRKCPRTLSGKHSFEGRNPTYDVIRGRTHTCKYCGRYKNK